MTEARARTVARHNGERAAGPTFVGAAETILLSPDSRWLLRADPGESVLYDTVGATTEILPVLSPGVPQWAPDSSYIVWLDTGAEVPALEFALVGGEVRGVFRVGLSALGEDLPLQEAFVLYP